MPALIAHWFLGFIHIHKEESAPPSISRQLFINKSTNAVNDISKSFQGVYTALRSCRTCGKLRSHWVQRRGGVGQWWNWGSKKAMAFYRPEVHFNSIVQFWVGRSYSGAAQLLRILWTVESDSLISKSALMLCDLGHLTSSPWISMFSFVK